MKRRQRTAHAVSGPGDNPCPLLVDETVKALREARTHIEAARDLMQAVGDHGQPLDVRHGALRAARLLADLKARINTGES